MFVAAEDVLPAVGKYLRNLSKAQVTELGIQMGLSYRWLKDNKCSDTFHYDVVDAWLKQQDSVADLCPPTWQNLVATLREVEQNGVADQVAKDQGIIYIYMYYSTCCKILGPMCKVRTQVIVCIATRMERWSSRLYVVTV